jgi:hypothetical protein
MKEEAAIEANKRLWKTSWFRRNIATIVAFLLAVFPLLLIGSLLWYAFETRLYLGYWPSYNRPDPKQLGWWPQHLAILLGLMSFPWVGLATVAVAIFGRSRSRDFPLWKIILTGCACMELLILYLKFDPGGFLGWFMD